MNLSNLYVMYLEKTFKLSNGFKALVDHHMSTVAKTIEFFAREDVQIDIKKEILESLQKQKQNHLDKEQIAYYNEKDATKDLISKIKMAFSNNCLNAEDLNFWSQFSYCHDNWTLAWELHSKCEKTLPQHSKD